MQPNNLFESGNQTLGFNYWASHAGTNMWHDWDEATVERDVFGLANAGARLLRVFPMWRDFQPITLLKKCFGEEKVVYFGEQPLGHDAIGAAGVDPVMLDRFAKLTAICRRANIKLIVGILTGWMSGRLYVPEALEGKNVMTDPFCLYWETKFVECFVSHFKDDDAIAAWELGNECNCMGPVHTPHEAWLWTSTIASAIKRCDTSRPVISGMHSLTPNGNWTMQHQGEAVDLLTIHPYPVFTPYCDLDPSPTIKPVAHLGAELSFTQDIGQKPCFAEEIGTTDIRISESNNCDFIRSNLFHALAYDGFPLLWWCGTYERDLAHAPYSWGHGERGMGLLLPDGEKPSLNEFRSFKAFCDSLPFSRLPAAKVHAHAILSAEDSWAACFGSFLLAMQTGMRLTYQYADQALPESDVYFCPSYENSTKEEWEQLMDRVKKGASLYISSDETLGTYYREICGFEMELQWAEAETYVYQGSTCSSQKSKVVRPTTAQVLLRDDTGRPLLLKHRYGKGTVYYCPAAIEQNYAVRSQVAYTKAGALHRAIYEILADDFCRDNLVHKSHYLTGVTEHAISAEETAVVVVNYDTQDVEETLELLPGHSVSAVYGASYQMLSPSRLSLALPHNNGCVVLLKKA